MIKKTIIIICVLILTGLQTLYSGNMMKENTPNDTSKTNVQYVEITNATIAYKTFGSGDPLIMCIGYASNMDMWATKAIQIFQEKYQVFVFDYRGMGLSTNTSPSFTISNLADDLNELLVALKIPKANILGWSMGGFVAQMFAVKYPEKISKLVLYATNCGDTITVNPKQEIVDILSNPASSPAQMLSTLFPDDWLAVHTEPWKFLPEANEPYNGSTIGLQYNAVQEWLSPGGGVSEKLSKLNVPVLLICGNKDKVVPWVNSTILADLIPSATIIRIDDAEHGLMYQIPETFAGYVLTFLNE